MKKILLGIFLILGVVSFAAPSRVNVTKIKQDGHMEVINNDNTYSFGELINENALLVVTYYVGDLGSGGVKGVSESLKKEQLNSQVKYIGSGESEAGYIHKLYAPEQGYYFYIVIGKNQKIKNYVVTGIFQTTEDLSSKNDLKDIINITVQEGEKYLK
ncbi:MULTISPECIES: hypothetical protein [Fusobacterium]|jgi:hypothetical protein|uniref:hypothetical protein n=1 Tax=Fusobacterium TaxID=848 RepID=UPI0004455619|nr:hypothetical protein [Fusobacterium sp. CM22]EUB14739.1 hypothetical protein HMPREF1500_2478 [Fusobacterium sp. CM22]